MAISNPCRSILVIFILPNILTIWLISTFHAWIANEESNNPSTGVVDYPLISWEKHSVGHVASNKTDLDFTATKDKNYFISVNAPKVKDKKTCKVMNSFQDIARCHPKRVKSVMKQKCNNPNRTIETWQDVQQCLNGRYSAKTPHLNETVIHLIGERNSGTKFAIYQLQQCFPYKQYGVKISRDFWRSKHFFQPIFTYREDDPMRHNSILISIFRDPTTWVAAMIRKPYHTPHHMKKLDKDTGQPIPLDDWRDFVSRPWTMSNRTEQDLDIVRNNLTRSVNCQKGFAWDEVNPCVYTNDDGLPDTVYRAQKPLYELRRGASGEPYDNILQMRSDKIVNFVLEQRFLQQQLGGYLAVRYEDMVRDGTTTMLQQVADILGLASLPPECKPQAPRPELATKRDIPEGLKQWVEDNLVLETERLLGYRD
jgi:hypothetical protein